MRGTVSKRFADQLGTYGATGFSLVDVLRVDANKPSGNFFLLVATAELDALEQRFPDVAHLRPLALQADGILLFFQGGHRPSRFPTRAALQETEGEVDVSAAIRLEKACDWPVRHAELAEQLESLGHPFRGAHGIPFASIVGSSDCLVCADGLFYYFAPSNYLYKNQVVARGLDELLGLLTTDLATFLGETASVTTCYDSDGQQHYPRKYRVNV